MTSMEGQTEYDDLRKIVVAIDYSASSEIALNAAIEDTRRSQGVLHVVHVAEPPLSEEATSAHAALDDLRRYVAPRLFAHAELHGLRDPVGAICHLRSGEPVREIAQAASDLDADALYVGSHGRRGVRRMLLGSIAERIIRHAPCPVVVMRAKGDRRDAWVDPDEAASDTLLVEPPCPRCLEVRRRTRGGELWCEEHRQSLGRRHVHHIVPRTGQMHVNPPLVFSEDVR